MLREIKERRSIRKYEVQVIPAAVLEEILQAGMLASSSKNRQPWKFIVVSGESKAEMLAALDIGLKREKKAPLLPGSAHYIGGAEYTRTVMEQAPILIFVINPLGLSLYKNLTPEERIYEICKAQSVGAAMENMALTAAEHGLGSLWICDTYFAYEELLCWLGEDGELYGAMAVGYPKEKPAARPRKDMASVVEWRG